MALSLALGRRSNVLLNWRFGLGGRGFCSQEVPSCKEEFQIGSYRLSFETNPKVAHLPPGCDGGIVLKMQNMENEDQSVSKVFSSVSPSLPLPQAAPRLTVNYQEKQFHCNEDVDGTCGVSFMRSQSARIIRTPIRRLFPSNIYYDVNVMARVICCDVEHDTDVMAANATSAALTLSDIPWGGPIGVVRVAMIQGQFVINPSRDELLNCDLDLVYACTREHKTLMADIQARYVWEKDREDAIQLAHRQAVKYLAPQIVLAEKAGKHKKDYTLAMLKDKDKESTIQKTKSLLKAFLPYSENEKVISTATQIRPGEGEAENLGGDLLLGVPSYSYKSRPVGVDAGDEAQISMIKDDGEITIAGKNEKRHMLAKQKVKTVFGNEVEVGGLHEDEVTEMRSCVEVNGGYVCASEFPVKQVDPFWGRSVQRQEYSMNGIFSGVDGFPERPSERRLQRIFLDLPKYQDESDLLEWLRSYDESEVSDSLAKV